MTPEGNLDPQQGMESTRNGSYLDRVTIKDSAPNIHDCLKQNIVGFEMNIKVIQRISIV